MKAAVLETPEEFNYAKHGLKVLLQELLETGTVSADRVKNKLGTPSCPGETGALFKNPIFRQYAERDSFVYSTETGNPIHLWRLKDDVDPETLKGLIQCQP